MDCGECGQNVGLTERHTFVDCALYSVRTHPGHPAPHEYAAALAHEVLDDRHMMRALDGEITRRNTRIAELEAGFAGLEDALTDSGEAADSLSKEYEGLEARFKFEHELAESLQAEVTRMDAEMETLRSRYEHALAASELQRERLEHPPDTGTRRRTTDWPAPIPVVEEEVGVSTEQSDSLEQPSAYPRVSDEEARLYLGNTGFIEGRAVADLLDARQALSDRDVRIKELERMVAEWQVAELRRSLPGIVDARDQASLPHASPCQNPALCGGFCEGRCQIAAMLTSVLDVLEFARERLAPHFWGNTRAYQYTYNAVCTAKFLAAQALNEIVAPEATDDP
jgi:hypothetical protein